MLRGRREGEERGGDTNSLADCAGTRMGSDESALERPSLATYQILEWVLGIRSVSECELAHPARRRH